MSPNQAHATDQAVLAAIVADRLTLLIRQPDRSRPAWKFPGGTVEKGETIPAALVREISDETGGFLIPHHGGTDSLGDEKITVEKLLERPVTTRNGKHTQHFFLVRCRAEDILYLDGKRLKEDDEETIETKVFSLEALEGMPDFLWPQLPLLQKLMESLRVTAA